MRRLGIVRSFLAGLVGFGYLYVGRIGYALALFFAGVSLVAVAGWTRLILKAESAYLYFSAALLAIFWFQVIHPVVIAARQKQAPIRPYNRWWVYVLWILAVSASWQLLSANRGQIFGYETFRIPAASMTPALIPGDIIVVDTWSYRDKDPSVGEILVFRDPSGVDYVKRVVGLPGDRIEVTDGVLIRNGVEIAEPYVHTPPKYRPYGRDIPPIELGSLEYYVLGDFRDNSKDSRMFGPISKYQLRGRVEYIGFSYSNGEVRWNRFPTDLANDT